MHAYIHTHYCTLQFTAAAPNHLYNAYSQVLISMLSHLVLSLLQQESRLQVVMHTVVDA